MKRHGLIGAAAFLLLAMVTGPAGATMNTNAEHALLMDAGSGQVLWAKDAFTPMPPASMSKLMTLELLFARLKDGRVHLNDTFPVSQRAWQESVTNTGSECFVAVGSRMRVEDLIRCIIIVSGNDACITVAEALGGTVEGFVDMMNTRAKQLGLKNSHFVNPDGLDQPPGQMMSAYDLAVLARHLIQDYPKYYHYFSERDFTWSNVHQPNRNTVLDKFPGADGLKTGHIEASGYGVTASAVRNGQRLILVLNGLRYPDLEKSGPKRRDWFVEQRRGDEAARLLEEGFREFRQYPLYAAGQVVGRAPVQNGTDDFVPVQVKAAVAPTLEVDSRPGLKVAFRYNTLAAPVAAGQMVGSLAISAPDFPGLSVPLYAAKPVAEEGIFGRLFSMFSRKKG
ncbi:MAG: D-alanyl-D-alanine carboxypeptidase [Alphaproteobacteria bacterium]|nr:D-alanyl-D-alanine carboxypeptidase [Alphaproteobacteria bacterium]